MGQEAPADVTPQEVPADVTPEEAPADVTPQEAPADATPQEAPADVTPQEAPADVTQEAPADVTPQEAPADVTPQEAQEVPAYYPDDNPDQWEEHFLRAFDRWQNFLQQPQLSPVQYRETSPGTLEGLRSKLSFFAEVPSLMTLAGRVVAEHELHRNEVL